MATKSELLELARLMERHPDQIMTDDVIDEEHDEHGKIVVERIGLMPDGPEWKIIIDALRVAANVQAVP